MHIAIDRVQDPKLIPQDQKWTVEIYKALEPGYGFIRIRKFQEDTGVDLAKAIRELYASGPLKGLVLDLRSDPGGLLNQAVAVSSAFLPKDSLVVYTDGRTPDEDPAGVTSHF